METLIFILMFLVILTFGFTVGIITFDILHGHKAAKAAAEPVKEEEKPQPQAPAAAEPAPAVEEPAPAPVEEPKEELAAAAESDEDGNVRFSADPQLTHEDKYAALTEEQRAWYDEIAAYAAAVEGAKRYVGKRYEEYAIGSRKIVRFNIRRGVIVCDFILRNSDFQAYVSENKVSVSNKPTSMRVTGEPVVQAAKGAIDIVVKSIDEEKQLKRRLANERRRQKYATMNGENRADSVEEKEGENKE